MPIWKISLVPDTGTFDVSMLVPSNFSLLIRNTDDIPATETNGTGVFSNVTPAVYTGAAITSHASVQYLVSAADVANLGNYMLFLTVTFPSGGIETFAMGAWKVVVK